MMCASTLEEKRHKGEIHDAGALKLAERGGFEPPVQLLTVQRFSKPPPSATRPPLRGKHRRMRCSHYSGKLHFFVSGRLKLVQVFARPATPTEINAMTHVSIIASASISTSMSAAIR